jgi:uncharacterized protein
MGQANMHEKIVDSNRAAKVAGITFNQPNTYVNDYEHVFTPIEKHKLDSLVRAIEKGSTIEIAIVTLDSTFTDKVDFDNTTLLIANKWGVGKKNKDNGILIGISKSLRMMRINNGYGIEKRISDVETKAIIDNIILPQFRKGHYYEGIKQGILALYAKVK